MPKIITLTTDFGYNDNYVAQMKGKILSINPDINIIDLNHDISSYNIKQAAFLISNTIDFFPKNTTHLAIVDFDSNIDPIVIMNENFTLVGPDNGIFDLIVDKYNIQSLIKIDKKFKNKTFRGIDLFAPLAVKIAEGINIEKLGKKREYKKKLDIFIPKDNELEFEIIYIDKFGNIILYTSKKIDLENIKSFIYKNKRYQCNHQKNYKKEGGYLITMGSYGHLELFLYKDNAADKLDAKLGDIIKFEV